MENTNAVGFRPLTGMVRERYDDNGHPYLFSPPYGDGTDAEDKANAEEMFSPPYGENPLSHGLRRASSPERGSLVQGNGSCKSSPFRGSWRAAPERVLRG